MPLSQDIRSVANRLLPPSVQRGIVSLKAASRRMVRDMRTRSDRPRSVPLERYQVPGRETFFGYYDLTPFSADNRFVLAHSCERVLDSPTPDRFADVGFFDRDREGQWTRLDATSSWCWQMGARLRWFPTPSSPYVAYNKLIHGRPAAAIFSLDESRIVEVLPAPLYDIAPDGQYGLSLNFSRLCWARPGYGYADAPDLTRDEKVPQRDGIWRVDIAERRKQLLLTYEDILSFQPRADFDEAVHYLNHISISPDGSRFFFLHLWIPGGRERNTSHSRALTVNSDGTALHLLSDPRRPSHYTWRNHHELVVFYVRPDGTGQYMLFSDQSDRREVLWSHLPEVDGHMSFHPLGEAVLTDTYPDRKYREQRLLLFTADSAQELLRIRPSARYTGELRCDLHPRWSPSGQFIAIDGASPSGRAVHTILAPQR